MLKLSKYGTLHWMKFLIEGSAFPALDNIKSVSFYAGVYLNVKMTLRNGFAGIATIGTTTNSIGRVDSAFPNH